MDEDRDGSGRSPVAGSVKHLIGKLVGDKRIEDKGAREKAVHSGTRSRGVVTVPDPHKPD